MHAVHQVALTVFIVAISFSCCLQFLGRPCSLSIKAVLLQQQQQLHDPRIASAPGHGSPLQQAPKPLLGTQETLVGRRNRTVALLVFAAQFRYGGNAPYEEPMGPNSRQHLYWLAVANRRLYAQQHGYPLYVLSHHLEAGRWPTWDKLLAAKAVLRHTHAEWLWFSDADAFVMNLSKPVSEVIAAAVQQSSAAGRGIPDIITAQDCLLPLNSGSMVLRNTPWTQQHLSDVWHADDHCNGFTDNGAFLELFKQQGVKQHYFQVPQRQLNSYPSLSPGSQGPECPNGTYKDGDLLLHFPGDFKGALPQYVQALQDQVLHSDTSAAGSLGPTTRAVRHTLSSAAGPITSSKPSGSQSFQKVGRGVKSHDVPCYAVYAAHTRGSTDAAAAQAAQQHAGLVDLNLVTVRQQGISTTTKVASITISIQQQQQQPEQPSRFGFQQPHKQNLGWPIALPSVPAIMDRFGAPPLPQAQHQQPHGVRLTDIEP